MSSLLHSGQYSDLTIKCGDETFAVHRNILLPASKVFAAACTSGFKEAQEGVIDLSVDDLDTVKRVLSYLYTADYDDEDHRAFATVSSRSHTPSTDDSAPSPTFPSALVNVRNTTVETPEPAAATHPKETAAPAASPEQVSVAALLNNVLVYALAEKYDIRPLKTFAHHKFEIRAAQDWDDWNNKWIIAVLREVYAATPANDTLLRSAMHKVCDRYADCLMVDEEFSAMVKKDSGLAYEILKSVYDAKERQRVEYEKKEKEWRSALQSRDDQIKSAKEWTKVELQATKDLIVKNVECQECEEPLALKMKRGGNTRQKTVELACDHCGKVH
ncbi:MAG: hypothetical protein Q9208_008128 [Pyrenodesmia sp. 3 TL-2023]